MGKVYELQNVFEFNQGKTKEKVMEEKFKDMDKDLEELDKEIEQIEKERELYRKETPAPRNEKVSEKLTNLTPKIIYEELTKTVIGQDEAVKQISNDVYLFAKSLSNESIVDLKPNIMVTGKSGTGKTYLVNKVAELLEVPYEVFDCSVATTTGYVGTSIKESLSRLYNKTNGKAYQTGGIIFLDEFDKLGGGTRGNDTVATVSVQQEILMALDKITGKNLTINIGTTQRENNKVVNCGKILFILGGSFEKGDGSNGIELMVKNRLKKNNTSRPIGFARDYEEPSKDKVNVSKDLRSQITKEDIVKFGILPEVMGRVNSLINLRPLEKKDMVGILKLEDGDISKFKQLFELEGIKLTITDSFYDKIIDSIEISTGARQLSSRVLEEMREVLFNLEQYRETKEIIL